MYPDDWFRIVRTHDKHKKANKTNKGYPMPQPEQYLANLFNKKIVTVADELNKNPGQVSAVVDN